MTGPVLTPIRRPSWTPNSCLDHRRDALEGRLHVQRGADRPERVVLVSLRQPEDGHDGVPDVFLDDPAVVLEDATQLLEGADGGRAARLGVVARRRA